MSLKCCPLHSLAPKSQPLSGPQISCQTDLSQKPMRLYTLSKGAESTFAGVVVKVWTALSPPSALPQKYIPNEVLPSYPSSAGREGEEKMLLSWSDGLYTLLPLLLTTRLAS